jgi:hypothetical protein
MRALLVALVLALATAVPVFADGGDDDGYAPAPTTVQSGDLSTLLP